MTRRIKVRSGPVPRKIVPPASAASAAGVDSDAIHDNVAAEIDALTEVTPVAGDWLIGEDTSDSDNKKKFDATHFLGGPSAINFTPVVVASGTAWAAGNAEQYGNYAEFGDLVFVTGRIKMGSTTTHGTGAYTTTLPVAADTSIAELRMIGHAFFNDADGAKLWSGIVQSQADGTSADLFHNDGTGGLVGLSETVPFTWATDDVLVYTMIYQKTAVT